MDSSILSGLEGFSDIGLRGGVDMRPTLLRVLTDLYVQKLSHTPDEERHYTELALRLLDSVDVQTRVAVAGRLAHHLSPPASVIERLMIDLPEVTAALRSKRPARLPNGPTATPTAVVAATSERIPKTEAARSATAVGLDAEIARELNALFFAANADERRLILVNLHLVAYSSATAGAPLVRDSTIGRKLEAAALARRREDFESELSHSLHISREQARRIVGDSLGEPIVIAAKALAVPRDLLYRILLFINTAVGHSVERVHALAMLYDEMTGQAAQDVVAIWQALDVNKDRRATGIHRPVLASGEAQPPRQAPFAQPAPAPAAKIVRREAS